jgi:hypothetical protein
MSETSLDASSDTSFGDISICEEIGELIEKCEEFHNHIHSCFETLENIQSFFLLNNNINVTHNNWTGDFNELLQLFHQDALTKIKNGQPSSFGEELLKMLDNTTFH